MEDNKDTENYRNEIFSKSVRAGKRTYFFDVKSTRSGDHYLTITESKKKFDQDGNFHFEKHKIFLYKEDFDKFKDGLSEVVEKVVSLNKTSSDSTGDSLESKSFKNLD
ncbi:PUR family DNA/RNA-binding protein [Flavobacteriales bacterium]|jgi:phosphomannomutase|nr:PUR family DNA/RNA-binding protein [Flavobacteriales bacterium]